MGTTSRTPDLVDVLRHPVANALRVSLAMLVLAPTTVNAAVLPQGQADMIERVELLSTVPDSVHSFKDQGLFYASERGLEKAAWSDSPDTRQDNGLTGDTRSPFGSDLVRSVLDLSGLKVSALADAIHVTRASVHKWLKGEGMTDEHLALMKTMQDTLLVLRAIRPHDLRAFLRSRSSAGEPLALLVAGERDALVGLALRPASRMTTHARLSAEGRVTAGVPGWLSPVRQRNWIPSVLSQAEMRDAMARLDRSGGIGDSEQDALIDLDDVDGYVARGFILE